MLGTHPSSWRRLGIVVLVGWVVLRFQERGEAQYQGRSIRFWFQQLCRTEASPFEPGRPSKVYEAQNALLELGTNAVPFLVGEVFTYRRDTVLRSNLHQLFQRLPEWAGRGAFTPYSEVRYQAERRLCGP